MASGDARRLLSGLVETAQPNHTQHSAQPCLTQRHLLKKVSVTGHGTLLLSSTA